MHSVKGSWIGQTFALANCSDSGGKKSRIRRSKEERKALTETFIKKYQEANNGNFPSLNVAHKEVGGSFYTVREIVREIIQENRVLGPAKLTADEQENNQFPEHYPLGSVSMEPHVHMSLPANESHFFSFNQSVSDEVVGVSNGQLNDQQQQRLESSVYIDGVVVDEECKDADASKISAHSNDEMLYTSQQISEETGSVENVIKYSTYEVTPITIKDASADVNDEMLYTNGQITQKTELVENVLKESSKVTAMATDDAGESSVHANDEILFTNGQISQKTESVEDVLNESIAEVIPIAIDDAIESSAHVDEEVLSTNEHFSQKTKLVNVVKESKSKVTSIASEIIVETFPIKSSAKLIQETDKSYVEAGILSRNRAGLETLKMEIKSEHGKAGSLSDGTKSMEKHSSGSLAEKSDESHADPSFERSIHSQATKSAIGSSLEDKEFQVDASGKDDSTLQTIGQNQDVAGIKQKLAPNNPQDEVATGTRADKRSALNRTKLESWEGTYKKRPTEANPVWGAFKAFINAFVKFWTE